MVKLKRFVARLYSLKSTANGTRLPALLLLTRATHRNIVSGRDEL